MGGCSGTRECGGAGVRGHAVIRRGPACGQWSGRVGGGGAVARKCGRAALRRPRCGRREPARTGAAEEPEEAERLGQGQAAGRRALGCRPQAEVSAGPARRLPLPRSLLPPRGGAGPAASPAALPAGTRRSCSRSRRRPMRRRRATSNGRPRRAAAPGPVPPAGCPAPPQAGSRRDPRHRPAPCGAIPY